MTCSESKLYAVVNPRICETDESVLLMKKGVLVSSRMVTLRVLES